MGIILVSIHFLISLHTFIYLHLTNASPFNFQKVTEYVAVRLSLLVSFPFINLKCFIFKSLVFALFDLSIIY